MIGSRENVSINLACLENPRARDPLSQAALTPEGQNGSERFGQYKNDPCPRVIQAGDFFVVLGSVLAGGESKTTKEYAKDKKHSSLLRNGDGYKKHQQCF